MLTPCPKCGILCDRCQEDAYSPNPDDRTCAKCHWLHAVKKGLATLEHANHVLIAHDRDPITEEDIKQYDRMLLINGSK